ncbi:MAG: DUF418 domain-containing protein [Dysgonomonas sp.]|nr:DUF418 domain-containing protein [Dysgonomonas sp.]
MKKTTRIDIADSLRGFAVLVILILHCMLHFNYFVFPENGSSLIIDIIDTFLFIIAYLFFISKAKFIFAMLFGLSFFIQNSNQKKKGKNFTYRFLWRLLILFGFGIFNGSFYNGDILVVFASVGVLLPLLVRLETKTLTILAIILLIFNPIIWTKSIYPIIGIENSLIDYKEWLLTSTEETLFNENILTALQSNIGRVSYNLIVSSWLGGITQTFLAYFIIGIIIGRKKLLIYSAFKMLIWKKVITISGIIALSLYLFTGYLYLDKSKTIFNIFPIINHFSSIFATLFVIGSFIILYYKKEKLRAILNKLIPYGKMSLTNYVAQSIIGTFIFHPWGLNLSEKLGNTYSFLIGISIFLLQYYFSCWWLKSHKQGPLEALWKKLTWIQLPKLKLNQQKQNIE